MTSTGVPARVPLAAAGSAAALAAATIVVDQVTKAIALAWLAPGTAVDVIDGLVALRLGLNTGVAFGLLVGLPGDWRWVVWLLSLGALLLMLRLSRQVLPHGGWRPRVGVGLILGGAAGNLIDRVRLGGVVDFLDVYWGDYHWPAFNAADSAISVGVALLAVSLSRQQAP